MDLICTPINPIRRPVKKSRPASAVSTFHSTSQPSVSGVLSGWPSIVAASVPNHTKIPALPYGKINGQSQQSWSPPNSQSANSGKSDPGLGRAVSINAYSGIDDWHPDGSDFHPDSADEMISGPKSTLDQPIASSQTTSSLSKNSTALITSQGQSLTRSAGEVGNLIISGPTEIRPAISSQTILAPTSISKNPMQEPVADPLTVSLQMVSNSSKNSLMQMANTSHERPLPLTLFIQPTASDDRAPTSAQPSKRSNHHTTSYPDDLMDANATVTQPVDPDDDAPTVAQLSNSFDYHAKDASDDGSAEGDKDDPVSDDVSSTQGDHDDPASNDNNKSESMDEERDIFNKADHKDLKTKSVCNVAPKPTSSRLHSAESIKHYKFKTRTVISGQLSKKKYPVKGIQSDTSLGPAIHPHC
ncbi:hypothetical protein F4604DRAFT_1685667 [Suillus subluteus]|nr:hypothetical protein F4604DRAFT_1685667 [Suillus subluteus]